MTRIVSSSDGTLTRASARDLRSALRSRGFADLAPAVTGALGAQDAIALCERLSVPVSAVGWSKLTPAQRGSYTRKAHVRQARKA